MRELDRKASEVYGISPLILMEHAGAGVADIAQKHFNPKSVLVICGKGNNGGDGFVAARHLFNRGVNVRVLFTGPTDALKPEAKTNFEILMKLKVPCDAKFIPDDAELMIDALFGIGLDRAVEEPYSSLIESMNESRKPVLAVDIPSGLNSDSGEVLGIAVKAAATAVLGMPKQGLYARQGPILAGQIYVVDIGLPQASS